jgi:hypothetical protein
MYFCALLFIPLLTVSVPPDVSPEKVAFIFREIQVRSASMIAFFGHFPAWTTRHQAGFYYGRETFPNEGPKRLV